MPTVRRLADNHVADSERVETPRRVSGVPRLVEAEEDTPAEDVQSIRSIKSG
jgi:hypothetical protein